jgi:hypothetical protein
VRECRRRRNTGTSCDVTVTELFMINWLFDTILTCVREAYIEASGIQIKCKIRRKAWMMIVEGL